MSLLVELDRRILDSLDACQTSWEGTEDPLALCVGLLRVPLPKWQQASLLTLLLDDPTNYWEERRSDLEMVSNESMLDAFIHSGPEWLRLSLVGLIASTAPGWLKNAVMRTIRLGPRDTWQVTRRNHRKLRLAREVAEKMAGPAGGGWDVVFEIVGRFDADMTMSPAAIKKVYNEVRATTSRDSGAFFLPLPADLGRIKTLTGSDLAGLSSHRSGGANGGCYFGYPL